MMDGEKDVIHPLSSIAPLPLLELWGVPPTQISVEKDLETEHRPLAPVSGSNQFEFYITTAKDEYLNFAETYIYVKARVVLRKADPITQADWDSVIPAQYFLHTIFSQVEILIGNKEVTLAPQTYPYRAYLETLLGFSDSAKKSYLSASLWGSDVERNARIKPNLQITSPNGSYFEMMGRLHLDLTFQERLLIGGCEVRIKLNPEDPKFYFKADDGLNPYLEFSDVTLISHRSKVTSHIISAHDRAISVAPARYPITRCEVRRQGIPQGQLDAILDNVIRGQMPRRIFVVLVDTDAFNGTYSKDPFHFKNMGVTFASAYIDGNQFPCHPYTPNFKRKLCIREFMALYCSLNQNSTDTYLTLGLDEFIDNKTIFTFNFAPDLSHGSGTGGHVNYIRKGSLRLHFRFAEQLKGAINVLIYAEFDNIIQVDEARNVYTNFN